MKLNKKMVQNIIFNLAETALIILSGLALHLGLKYILMIILVFVISRGLIGKPLHFKTWYRCLIWSLLVLVSLFVILKIDLVLSIVFAIFSAFIMTGKANVNDMYMWKNNDDLSRIAKKNGILLDDVNFVEPLLDYRYDRVDTYFDETVGDFVERCATGTYLITMPNHITTAIDGIIYDTFDCRDRQLWDVWKVK